jgi:uncharacterized phage protein (TIGR02220 family)
VPKPSLVDSAESTVQTEFKLANGTGTEQAPKLNGRPRLSGRYREHESIVGRVLDALTKRTGTKYKLCDSHAQLICARIRDDGATEADLRMVVWDRANRWLGSDQEQYLRPSTLFRPKHWDEYLAQAKAAWKKTFGDQQPKLTLAEDPDVSG